MIAVITGDIISSRKLVNQEKWLIPLKALLNIWGKSPETWKIDRGDFFQVEITNIEDVLLNALKIKALIKKVESNAENKKSSTIDVRLAIGIGEKSYAGESISESNGTAFINSGEKFDVLKKEDVTIGVKTPWKSFDEEINLYLKLACTFMDKWTVSSAELVQVILNNPNITQEEIGKRLGIKQNSVSGRRNRANVNKILEVNKMFQQKLKLLVK